MLTPREYRALHAEWRRARGIPEPLTKEQQDNLEWGRKYIQEAQKKALVDEMARRKASGMMVVHRIPEVQQQRVQ